LSAFDRNFHEQHILVQPLPFSDLDESYPLINGRGYPDTVAPAPVVNSKVQEVLGLEDPYPSQKIDSRVVATSGQRILLRLSNVSLSDFHTVTVLGIPMRVIGKDAKLLRSPTGLDLSYETSSVTIGPGETADVILDTAGVAPGTYFLYDARLNHLCNDEEDFGGMMTEIVVQ
jgi:FtsP/CotA-like multicopper oxidase with cupredoxin domain